MKFINLTVKVPLGLKNVLEFEAQRSGTTVKRLAGQILTHGYNTLAKEHEAKMQAQAEADRAKHEAQTTEEGQDDEAVSEGEG